MLTTHRFRLYPSKKQEEKLLWTLDQCRQTYNTLLSELQEQKVIDKAQIQGLLPDMKICDPELNKVYSKTLQYECYRLFSNLRALSQSKKNKRKVGRLRFKGKGWFKTFTYNQSGFKLINIGKRCQTLHLSKIGKIPIRCHRNVKGKIKQITIKKEVSGKWFASIIEEKNEEIKKAQIKKVIGIDLGLTDFIFDSDGMKVPNPRHLKKHTEKLVRLQRKLSKKKIGSENRNKWRIRLARQYEKLVNTRDDFLHKASRYYVNNYDAIAMEDMPIINMVHNKYLSKSILDASWGKLRQMISYKAERAGKRFMPVNYRGTTQRCSNCCKVIKKDLSMRTHKCNYCGLITSRDHNSALEIKNLMLIEIGQELSESTLVEIEALPLTRQLPSMKQEAPCES
ncbi:transposase [Candidatus Woesearchaeota archaeon]|jgi:putative transposase|nr:transposase [Candidatus Woesearchaeota archaeon]|tara:strand:- start:5592 stop:6779 length:1188 start_codon:yes stop_codon:yes gene_type:complete